MVVIYGWSYTNFNNYFGWDGNEAKYNAWENFWARKIDAYIFTDSAASPRLTAVGEVAEVGDIVNELMTQMQLYIKADATESPLETGLYDAIGFPSFKGSNRGVGTGHYKVLNKLRRKYSETEGRVDSIRLGVNPDQNKFSSGGLFY